MDYIPFIQSINFIILLRNVIYCMDNIYFLHRLYKMKRHSKNYPTVDHWSPAASQWGKRRKLNSLADIATARDSLRARGDQIMTGSVRTVTLVPSARLAQRDPYRPDDTASIKSTQLPAGNVSRRQAEIHIILHMFYTKYELYMFYTKNGLYIFYKKHKIWTPSRKCIQGTRRNFT
jgi:hypothetical protein